MLEVAVNKIGEHEDHKDGIYTVMEHGEYMDDVIVSHNAQLKSDEKEYDVNTYADRMTNLENKITKHKMKSINSKEDAKRRR